MFGETPYDLRFDLLGYRVRISPWFWAVALMLAWQNGIDQVGLLVLIACIFVSIFLHEYGHGLVARAFGCEPREILLYAMGGLCFFVPPRNLRRWQSILITLAGPAVNFALAGAALGIAILTTGKDLSRAADIALGFMVILNLFWGIVNLLPIIPLDGGRIAEDLLAIVDPGPAKLRAYTLSIITCGLVIAWMAWMGHNSLWNYMLVGLLMFWNIQGYQAERMRWGSGWSSGGDDWWKR